MLIRTPNLSKRIASHLSSDSIFDGLANLHESTQAGVLGNVLSLDEQQTRYITCGVVIAALHA